MNHVRDYYFMFYTYVIQSKKSKRLYTGFTNNLQKRIKQHEDGKSLWTKHKGPWKLIYYEASISRNDAIAREKYLKTGMGKRYINNRLKHFLSLT